MSGQEYKGLLLGKAGMDRRDDGSFGSGGMIRLRIGNSSQRSWLKRVTMFTKEFQRTF